MRRRVCRLEESSESQGTGDEGDHGLLGRGGTRELSRGRRRRGSGSVARRGRLEGSRRRRSGSIATSGDGDNRVCGRDGGGDDRGRVGDGGDGSGCLVAWNRRGDDSGVSRDRGRDNDGGVVARNRRYNRRRGGHNGSVSRDRRCDDRSAGDRLSEGGRVGGGSVRHGCVVRGVRGRNHVGAARVRRRSSGIRWWGRRSVSGRSVLGG